MFAVSENISMFAEQTGCRLFTSQPDIFKAVNTATLWRRFYVSSLDRSANFQRGVALFVHINQILSRMQTGKNLTTGAQGASTSTPRGAKTVSKDQSLYSKGRFIQLKGQLNKAERELQELKAQKSARAVYRVRLLSYFYFSDKTSSTYEIDKEVEANSRVEAIGKMVIEMAQARPNHKIDMSGITSMGGVRICTKVRDL